MKNYILSKGPSINDVRILGGGGGPRNSDIFGHGGEGGSRKLGRPNFSVIFLEKQKPKRGFLL